MNDSPYPPELRPVIIRGAADQHGLRHTVWQWQWHCRDCRQWHDLTCTDTTLTGSFDTFADLASQVRNVGLPTVDDDWEDDLSDAQDDAPPAP